MWTQKRKTQLLPSAGRKYWMWTPEEDELGAIAAANLSPQSRRISFGSMWSGVVDK